MADAMARVSVLWRIAHEAMQACPPRVTLAVQALRVVDSMAVSDLQVRVANSVRLAQILVKHTTATKAARTLLERSLPLVDARSPAYFELLAMLCDVDALSGGQSGSDLLLRPLTDAVAECRLAGHSLWFYQLTVKLVLLHERQARHGESLSALSRAIQVAEDAQDQDASLALHSVRLRILVCSGDRAAALDALDTLMNAIGATGADRLPSLAFARITCQGALLDLCSDDAIVRHGPKLFLPGNASSAAEPRDPYFASLTLLMEARWHRISSIDHSLSLLGKSRLLARDSFMVPSTSQLHRTRQLCLLEEIAGTAALVYMATSQMPRVEDEIILRDSALAAQGLRPADRDGHRYLCALALQRVGRVEESMRAWFSLASSTRRKELAAVAALHLRLMSFMEGDKGQQAEGLAQQSAAHVFEGVQASFAVDAFQSYVLACGDFLIGAQQTAKDKLGVTLGKLRKRSYFEIIAPTLLLLGDIYEHLNEGHAVEMIEKALALAHAQRMHLIYSYCATKRYHAVPANPEQRHALATHIGEALAAHDAGSNVRKLTVES